MGVVNPYRIARALDMSLSELFAEVEARKGRATVSIAEAEASVGVVNSSEALKKSTSLSSEEGISLHATQFLSRPL